MASIKISAQAYSSSGWRTLFWLVPVSVLAPALGFVVLRDRVADGARLAPFLSLPTLAVVFFLFYGMRRREISLTVQGRLVSIAGWRRSGYEGNVTRIELVPWIMPGLGVAEGAVACLHFHDGTRFSVGAWGYAAPKATGSTNSADCFVDAKTLASLLVAMGEPNQAEKPLEHESSFTLVKYGGVASALGGMKWWFGTMAFLGVFGAVFGERLMQRPWGVAVVGVVSLLAIGVGLAKSFAHSAREKPKYTFTLGKGVVCLRDANAATLWESPQASLAPTRETYVYRTKYGSHRFPVLVLSGPLSTLRLGVWNPQAGWQQGDARDGAAPQYLVASPDWERLVSALAAGAGRAYP
ncbi:MAG: hypothetical protein SF187_11840 [Deltaproteobacteria bacterium]|nr:hypothetical protein [Deltaproteobacteria bacterium]